MFFQNNISIFLTNQFYGMSIIYMNIYIYVYILFLFFSLLFIFDIKKIKTLNNLKTLNKNNFLSLTIVLLFLSMAGIPPLLGFVGKFLLFNFLFLTQKFIFILVFSTLNFFAIYFYIQNLRFLISKTQLNYFLVSGYFFFLNKNLVNVIVFLNFLNFFGILFFEDLLYYFLNILFLKCF